MIALKISIILCVISIFIAFYGYKRHIQATEKLREANKTYHYAYRAWPRLNSRPAGYFISFLGINAVGVYVDFNTEDGHRCEVLIKLFTFIPTDSEDKAFAIREAEELIEKL